MEAVLDAKSGFDFTLTEPMKTAIENYKKMGECLGKVFDGVIPESVSYKGEDEITKDINTHWWALEKAIEKQLLRQLHADTYGKIPNEGKNKPVEAFSSPN